VEPEFNVLCYDGDGRLYKICGCYEFRDAWSEWFRYLDWNRVALCTIERADGTEILRSDPSQTGEKIIERRQRIRELWVTGHPEDYHHDSWETEIVLPGGEVIN
jgi:hypothetical protein